MNPLIQLRSPNPILVENEHGSIPAKRKVRRPILDKNLPEQNTTSRPDIHSILAPSIHIAIHADLDPVRDADARHSKHATVRQEGLAVDGGQVQCIAKRVSQNFH